MHDKHDKTNGNRGEVISDDNKDFASLMRSAQEVIDAEMSHIGPETFSPHSEQEPSFADRVIYDLTDVVEEGPVPRALTVAEFDVELMKKVSEVAERIAREIVPEIAERVIREEIERLKKR